MSTAGPVPEQYLAGDLPGRIALIAESFERLLGRRLVDTGNDPVRALWEAPCAILAHGTQPDPVFFFGNRYALDAFECDVADFIRMPSRLSAEAPLREERQALLDRVTQEGFIEDYSGVRITATGRRFPIENAIVWNLVEKAGSCAGQAAMFVL